MLLRNIFISGIWSYLNIVLKGIFATSVVLIFSKYLDVTVYGYFVTADLIISFFSFFGEIGLTNYIINRA